MRHSARSEETLARLVHQSVTGEDLYEALRGYWHPVAYVSELADGGPLPVTLLDEPLVLARIDGAVSAFRDICVHRGTALSLGSVDESGLRCGYHGWTYNGEGRCTKIPSRPDLQIPSRARLTAYLAAEHLGLVWVCLTGDPVYPLPENPYFGDESFRLVEVEPYNWNCALPRRIQNYVDFGHFAWVHDGVLGDSDHPEVPDHSIGRHRNELRFDHPHMAEPPDSGKNKSLEIEGAVEVTLDYRLFMPNTILLDQYIESVDQRYLLFFSVCPTVRPERGAADRRRRPGRHRVPALAARDRQGHRIGRESRPLCGERLQLGVADNWHDCGGLGHGSLLSGSAVRDGLRSRRGAVEAIRSSASSRGGRDGGLRRRRECRACSIARSEEPDRVEPRACGGRPRFGNTRLVRANTDSPYYRGLADVLVKAFGPPRVLAAALARIDNIDTAHIYGSWAARLLGASTGSGNFHATVTQRPLVEIDLTTARTETGPRPRPS